MWVVVSGRGRRRADRDVRDLDRDPGRPAARPGRRRVRRAGRAVGAPGRRRDRARRARRPARRPDGREGGAERAPGRPGGGRERPHPRAAGAPRRRSTRPTWPGSTRPTGGWRWPGRSTPTWSATRWRCADRRLVRLLRLSRRHPAPRFFDIDVPGPRTNRPDARRTYRCKGRCRGGGCHRRRRWTAGGEHPRGYHEREESRWFRPQRRDCLLEHVIPAAPRSMTMSDQTTPVPPVTGSARVKRGMAEMLKGGVIMDVVTPGAGQDRRGRRRGRGDGAGAGAGRHPGPGRRVPDVRPGHDRRHHRRGVHPGHGQGPHRPLRRGPGAAGARGRLRRRVRGADPGRLRQPHRQVGVHGAVRLRRDQPGRGAAPHHRGRRDDPVQGRGRYRRRLQRDHPHAQDPGRDPAADLAEPGRALRRGQGAAGAVRPGRARSPRPASCRWCCSPPAASRPRPTRR